MTPFSRITFVENLTVGMFLGGWAVMVAVGMLPATAFSARIVGRVRGALGGVLFLSGYALVWLLLGVAGFVVLAPVAPVVGWAGAGVALAATAAYELSPLKDACLRRCRTPLRFLLEPALVGGMRHGLDCAGCCAFLMALMFALGLMGIGWAALLALVVLVQKAAPFGARSPRVLAAGLGTAAAVSTWP
jgi:predicted metal-binding membrane protein